MSLVRSRRTQDMDPEGPSPVVPASLIDPLQEVRALKRWVAIGVYTAILGSEPFYFFVLHYSWPQLLSGLVVGMISPSLQSKGLSTRSSNSANAAPTRAACSRS